MYELIDLRKEKWNYDANSGSTGVYLKEIKYVDWKKYYIKLPYFDSVYGFIGTEYINEVVAGRLGRCLGLPVLQQLLERVIVSIDGVEYKTYINKSLSYKLEGYNRMTADSLFKLKKFEDEVPIDTLRRLGFSDLVDLYLMWDYLIIGKDRHSGNIEFLVKEDEIIPSPIFDNGISFLCPIYLNDPKFKEKVLDFNVFKNNTSNSFLGSRDLEYNLNFIRHPITVRKLTRQSRDYIMQDLKETIPSFYLDKVWSIICYRYLRLRKEGLIREV